jgi:hypothetical protein
MDGPLSGRRFDPTGSPIGAEVVLSDTGTVDAAMSPFVVADASGGFAAFWNAAGLDMHSRRFDASNVPIAASVLVAELALPSVQPLTTDTGYVLVYHAPWLNGVAVALDAAGAPAGSPLPVVGDRRRALRGIASGSNGRLTALSHSSPAGLYRFCEESDATCDRCAGFDDSIDADGDGMPDACDLCTNVADVRTLEKAKIYVTSGGDAKVSKLRVSGRAALSIPFTALAPDVDGLRVSVLGNIFGNIVDDRLPSAGVTGAWELSSSATKWTFKGESDEDSSVDEGSWVVQVVDRSKQAPNLVAVKVKHTGGSYRFDRDNVPPHDVPPIVRILFGSDADGSAGICGERAFSPDGCRTILGGIDSFRCR